MSRSSDAPCCKILTCETWVTRPEWWAYAKEHPRDVPFPLVDRSPCMEPFFDPYGVPGQRQAVVSGLCRLLKGFRIGDRLLYVTRVHPKVAADLGLPSRQFTGGAVYFGVGAVRVREVFDTHEKAAERFQPRRYVVAPRTTPYPPNLAHAPTPVAAVARGACITYPIDPSGGKKRYSLTPKHVKPSMYRDHYGEYHKRRCDKKLRAALCEIEIVDDHECLTLIPKRAPILTAADWEDRRQNQPGLLVSKFVFDRLCEKIATGGVAIIPKSAD